MRMTNTERVTLHRQRDRLGMFEGKRDLQTTGILTAADDPEITVSGYLFELSQRLCRIDFPAQPEEASRWVDWAPKPELNPSSEDARTGISSSLAR
jgi:hypothetical protein